MAILNLCDKNKTISDFNKIQSFLSEYNIELTQWEASIPLNDDDNQETILKAYDHEIGPYMKAKGFTTADVISVNPQTENIEAIRQKFLCEHTHSEDEVRYFVDGEGTFYFNLDDQVVSVLCQKGDFLAVPSGYKHWFDLAPKYTVKAIRIFSNPEGWVANYTESGIDKKYIGD